MKKLLISLFLLIFCVSGYATTIKQIVFFGDSASDNGNLYRSTLKLIPKSPPYYEGRFSNGATWAEHVSDYLQKEGGITAKNYAVGSATAIFHRPTSSSIAFSTLGLQVNKYLIGSVFQDKSETLYVIWMGLNDYIMDEDTSVDELTSDVVNNIIWAVNTLTNKGATRFLIVNLPDLSWTPRGQASSAELKARYTALTQAHNTKLKAFVDSVNQTSAQTDVKIAFIDIYNLLGAMIADPAPFNQKYKTNLIDTKTACFSGGYTLQSRLARASIEKQLRLSLQAKSADVDVAALSQAIENTPTLQVAYETALLSDAGVESCENPDEHVFWDKLHPSKAAHYVLGQEAIETLLKAQMVS